MNEIIYSNGTRLPITSKDKDVAEAVIKWLCIGAIIDGIRFGIMLQIYIYHQPPNEKSDIGQMYITLESRWIIYNSIQELNDNSENNIPELTNEEAIQQIFTIRGRIITNVELRKDYLHLIITLDDGRVIFINGKDDFYETWEIGTTHDNPKETYLIVACPGGNISVWEPKKTKTKGRPTRG